MIKVGDEVRILNNTAGSMRIHNFAIGDIVEVISVYDNDNIVAIGKYEGSNDAVEQYLMNTKNFKQFEKVE